MKSATLSLAFAAAMLASTGGAMATSHTISLDTFCDQLSFTYSTTTAAMVEQSGSCTADVMTGFTVKVRGFTNKFLYVGGPRFGDGTAWGFLVSLPIATGGSWGLYHSTDGVNVSLAASGTYTKISALKAPNGKSPAGVGPAKPTKLLGAIPLPDHLSLHQ
jgi:hypothetical protein